MSSLPAAASAPDDEGAAPCSGVASGAGEGAGATGVDATGVGATGVGCCCAAGSSTGLDTGISGSTAGMGGRSFGPAHVGSQHSDQGDSNQRKS